MPRKANDMRKLSNAKEIPWGGFIEIRMTDEEKEAFYLYEKESVADMWVSFVEALGAGLKFGMSYDLAGDFYTATFTGHGFVLIGLDERYCMTARAPEWQQAIALIVYKHTVLAQMDWSGFMPKTGRMANFG